MSTRITNNGNYVVNNTTNYVVLDIIAAVLDVKGYVVGTIARQGTVVGSITHAHGVAGTITRGGAVQGSLRRVGGVVGAISLGNPLVYYVDATGGLDANDGLSEAAAWQTITKVNAAVAAGDTVQFKRGETWAGITLAAQSGVSYEAYGAGAKPIIDGTLTVDCILANGKSDVQFSNLDCRNGLDYGIACGKSGAVPASLIEITDCDISNPGNDGILFIDGAHSCTVQDTTVTTVRNRLGTYIASGVEIADDAHDILVERVTVSGSVNHGLAIHAHTGEGLPYDITVRDCTFHTNTQHGINIMVNDGATNAAIPSITLEGVTSRNNTLQGLSITRQSAAAPYPAGVTFTDCTFRSSPAGVYQAIIRGASHVFRRCVFSGDNRGVFLENVASLTFEHNTLYLPNGTSFIGVLNISGAGTNGATIRNNIIATTSTGNLCIGAASGATTGLAINYNLYYTPSGVGANRWGWQGTNGSWATWKINSGQDANSPTPASPAFTNQGTHDFTLLAGSPALNVGVLIAGVNDDYLGAGPDLGYYESS